MFSVLFAFLRKLLTAFYIQNKFQFEWKAWPLRNGHLFIDLRCLSCTCFRSCEHSYIVGSLEFCAHRALQTLYATGTAGNSKHMYLTQLLLTLILQCPNQTSLKKHKFKDQIIKTFKAVTEED